MIFRTSESDNVQQEYILLFQSDISSTGTSGLDGIFLALQLVVDDRDITVSSQLHLYYKRFNTRCDMVLAGWAIVHRYLRQRSSVKSCGNDIVLEMYLAPILLKCLVKIYICILLCNTAQVLKLLCENEKEIANRKSIQR